MVIEKSEILSGRRKTGFINWSTSRAGLTAITFFFNVGLHPIGLPSLIAGKLEIKERPKEYECIFRRRMGEISHRLAEQYAAHNRFLRERLGNADKKSLGRTEYLFEWGSICSYMDIKTGECVIRVEY